MSYNVTQSIGQGFLPSCDFFCFTCETRPFHF